MFPWQVFGRGEQALAWSRLVWHGFVGRGGLAFGNVYRCDARHEFGRGEGGVE